jgi:hypothetical protein
MLLQYKMIKRAILFSAMLALSQIAVQAQTTQPPGGGGYQALQILTFTAAQPKRLITTLWSQRHFIKDLV